MSILHEVEEALIVVITHIEEQEHEMEVADNVDGEEMLLIMVEEVVQAE